MAYDPFSGTGSLGANAGAPGVPGISFAPSATGGLGLNPYTAITSPAQVTPGTLPAGQFGFGFGANGMPSFNPSALWGATNNLLAGTGLTLAQAPPYQAPNYGGPTGAPGSGGPPRMVPPHGYPASLPQPAPPPKPPIPAPTGPNPQAIQRQFQMARHGLGAYPSGFGPQGRISAPAPRMNLFGQPTGPGYRTPMNPYTTRQPL